MNHVPVLLKEAVKFLKPERGKVFIDATYGGGGHTSALLDKIGKQGRVLALDADDSAQPKKFENLIFVAGNFRDIRRIAGENGFSQVDGIIFDLGFSSAELDDPSRGFSFLRGGPLDMRFDRSRGVTAGQLLNTRSVDDLANIFKIYGEEKFAKRIAKEIVKSQEARPIKSTGELYELIKRALPSPVRHKADDSARRIFQALRIEVNSELDSLSEALPQAYELLKSGGRLVAISFHSLEDRIVKNFFKEYARGCVCPPEFPQCVCGKNSKMRILTAKPVIPSEEEMKANSRSKSAKLRCAEKI